MPRPDFLSRHDSAEGSSLAGTMERPDKLEWRTRLREALRSMTPAERETGSKALCASVLQHPHWRSAHNVLVFAPLKDEPDVTELLAEGWRESKIMAVPRFDLGNGIYGAAQLSTRAQLVPGRFGVREPEAGCPSVPLNQLDLILVPGVGFDFAGRRLGRGKGFYDRLLAQVRGHKCGVAFEQQLVAELPEEPHDVRVDSILTPTRWLSARVD
jgi:5-formyltetrahydrofolate cyclo-ligase